MKKRADSFFGIHFDFHAMPGQIVGEDFRPEAFSELLDRAKPDFVQCDTKGHPGLSSYPTKVGTPADFIKNDVLATWRKLTKERGIALYGHHSGLFDIKAATEHPDWAVKNEDGTVSDKFLSVFSPYVDELLIPQLRELALDYELDGAWIDGECWATYLDYSDYAVAAYKKEFGKPAPRSDDPDFENYREFIRKGFERYVTHYIEEIKKIRPDFEITSNWMYSNFMPEKLTVPVDFLSGDYPPTNAVETARHASRCLAARNIAWDLMAWGQNSIPPGYTGVNRSTKEYEQYCQEAAIVISLGGGFQFFNIMYGGGGTVQPWAIGLWEKVSKFCREREFCHKAKIVHQIGIIYPMERVSSDVSKLYSDGLGSYKALCSWNNCMLDCGYSTEVIYESDLKELDKYGVIVIPDTLQLAPSSTKALEEYVKNGGRLIVDLKAADLFTDFALIKKNETVNKLIFIEGNEALAAIEGDFTEFEGEAEKVVFAYETNYHTGKKLTCAINKKIERGNITFMGLNFAAAYQSNITSAIKDFMKNLVAFTGFKPMVEISGSAYAELCITTKENRLIVNIANTAGPSAIRHIRGYNEVPKIGPVKVRLNTKEPKRVIRIPENTELEFNYDSKNNFAEFEFDIIHIHTAAIIEF